MQLDDLKEAWAAHEALLARSVAIDERLLREVVLRKVRLRLVPYVACRALEVALGLAVTLAAGSVVAEHAGEPRYLVVGGALAAFAVAMTALCAHLLVGALRLDRAGPVAAMQRELERLRVAEYRALKWALLGGALLWLPALLVPFEALTGVDALARVPLPYLATNLVVGIVVLGLGQGLSRRYVERDLGGIGGRVVGALSGRALADSRRHLDELARFERGE